jgi:hypothetical protein
VQSRLHQRREDVTIAPLHGFVVPVAELKKRAGTLGYVVRARFKPVRDALKAFPGRIASGLFGRNREYHARPSEAAPLGRAT